MTLPHAWMQQAESDLRAAKRLDNHAIASTRCQAISNYQQCVEKSIKAVLEKLFGAGLIGQGSDDDTFTAGEVKRIRNCAGMLVPRLRKILEALDLLYP